MNIDDRVQLILKEKLYPLLKSKGKQNVGDFYANTVSIAECLEDDSISPSQAQSIAEGMVRSAEAEVFKAMHPIAPRKWRGWLSKKGKEF